MVFESEKVMFEIYKETVYNGHYRVVYFTELGDLNKEFDINHAMAGEHYYDGFINNFRRVEAKQAIRKILQRLNDGEQVSVKEIDSELQPFMPQAANTGS